jgi:hypothetical protein
MANIVLEMKVVCLDIVDINRYLRILVPAGLSRLS